MSNTPTDKSDEVRARLKLLVDSLQDIAFVPNTDAERAHASRLARARQLAEHKLLAELDRDFAPPVVVAVAGGTNVGKSTIFNAVLENEVSSVDARAGHTVCPVVAGGTDAGDLMTALLPGYRLVHGSKVAGNVADDGSLCLAEVSTPGGAVVVDSPDIDSTVRSHHSRAHDVLIAADVVLFVTSPTKYNDKRCVDFLMDATAMGKRVIVLFNLLPAPDLRPDSGSRRDLLEDLQRSVLSRLHTPEKSPRVMEFQSHLRPGGVPADFRKTLAADAAPAREEIELAARNAGATKRSVARVGARYLERSLEQPLAALREQATSLKSIRCCLEQSGSNAFADYEAFLRGRDFLDLEVVLSRLISRFRVPVLDDVLDAVTSVPKWLVGTILRRPTLDEKRQDEAEVVRAREVELMSRVRVEFARALEERASDEVAHRIYSDLVNVDYFARDLAAAWSAESERKTATRERWLSEFESELASKIESSPGMRKLLQSLKAVFELGAGVGAAILTGGIGTGDLLWAPAATKAVHMLIGLLGKEYFSAKREEYVQLQKDSFVKGVNKVLLEWLRNGLPSTPRTEDVDSLGDDVAWLAKSF